MSYRVRARPLLGTFVEVAAEDCFAKADRTINDAFTEIELIQSLMSFQDPASDLSRLNESIGNEIALHPHTARVLKRALVLGRKTNGLFNCTLGGRLVNKGLLPNHSGDEPIEFGADEDVLLDGCNAVVLRPIRITLDGIAKGYAVDCAVSKLRRLGIRSGWVNAGGDLRVFGEARLSLRRKDHRGTVNDIGQLRNSAFATTSVFAERTARYGALLAGAGSDRVAPCTWSVKADFAWLADALTKVACLATTNLHRQRLIKSLGGCLV